MCACVCAYSHTYIHEYKYVHVLFPDILLASTLTFISDPHVFVAINDDIQRHPITVNNGKLRLLTLTTTESTFTLAL